MPSISGGVLVRRVSVGTVSRRLRPHSAGRRAPPPAVTGPSNTSSSAAPAPSFFPPRGVASRPPAAPGGLLRFFPFRAEPHHPAAQERGFRARVGPAGLPHRLARRSRHVARRG